jgi:hypothetical protein
VPLSEFAARGRAVSNHHSHTGHGRRDQLTAGERTRILRMLRDEGGRVADEESQVFYGVPPAPKDYDFDFDEGGAAIAPAPVARPDVPAKPAVVVGLAQARRQKRQSGVPPAAPGRRGPPAVPPPQQPAQPAASGRPRAPLPKPFDGEPTRAVNADADLLAAVRNAPGPGRVGPFDDMPTRLGNVDARLLDEGAIEDAFATMPATTTQPQVPRAPDYDDAEATRMQSMDHIQAQHRAPPPKPPAKSGQLDERTRAVDIRNDASMSDVDWDID